MRMRLLFSEEDEVRKKKTLIVVVAFLLIPVLLGLYAVTGPEGGLIAGVTPTAFPSPSAVATVTPPAATFTATATPSATATAEATVTPPVPAATATAMPTASATPVAEATATPVPSEPTVIPTATPVVLEPALTPTATLLFTPTPVRPEPTATSTPVRPEPTILPTATSVALEPTPTPTVVPIAPLVAPVITTPPDGSVLKDDWPTTIAGTAPPNTTVQVYDDGNLVGTTAADAQGDWALVVDEPLEQGEHTVTAVASDDVGRTSDPSVAVTFAVVIERLPVTGSSWFERWLDRLLAIAFP
jgi:hypothetical protein